jgi:hypothetical protein
MPPIILSINYAPIILSINYAPSFPQQTMPPSLLSCDLWQLTCMSHKLCPNPQYDYTPYAPIPFTLYIHKSYAPSHYDSLWLPYDLMTFLWLVMTCYDSFMYFHMTFPFMTQNDSCSSKGIKRPQFLQETVSQTPPLWFTPYSSESKHPLWFTLFSS